jgi:lipopolysaccharide transport system permease protein
MFVAAGLFPWFALSQALGRSSGILTEYATFARRGAAPLPLLAAIPALEATLTLAAALVALAALSMASGTASPRLLVLVPLLAVQGLLALGLGWAVSALGGLHRAATDFVPLALYLLLLTAPVLHTGSGVPSPWRDLVALNPLTPLIHGYRFALGCGGELSGAGVLGLAAATTAALAVGAACLRRFKPWASELL